MRSILLIAALTVILIVASAAIAMAQFNCLTDTFNYYNLALNDNDGWDGSAGIEIQTPIQSVKIIGGAGATDAIRLTNCGDIGGGYIVVQANIHPGSYGDNTFWGLWIDDTSSVNLARWYGTGSTARGRIGGSANVTEPQTLTGGNDELKVILRLGPDISEFFFNDMFIGSLSHAGAGDFIGRIRFERMDNINAYGNDIWFDNLHIGQDNTPPGPVKNFVASPGPFLRNNLAWTNPVGGGFVATMIRFKTTGYPTGPTDGTQIYHGTGTSFLHTGLVNGVRYYYSAFSHDMIPNYAAPAQVSAVAHF